jgi:hypothetical protein
VIKEVLLLLGKNMVYERQEGVYGMLCLTSDMPPVGNGEYYV